LKLVSGISDTSSWVDIVLSREELEMLAESFVLAGPCTLDQEIVCMGIRVDEEYDPNVPD
jgi:hypothetical protein